MTIEATGYWWLGHPNFGDLLTPLLMARFAGALVRWAPAKEADLVCVGSILDVLPAGWSGMVVGSGKLREYTNLDLTGADVLAVRGPLTAKGAVGLRPGSYAYGDPALLADELVTVNKEYDLGLVPHWSDIELEYRQEFQKYDPIVIRPSGDPLDVIKQIGRCRKIVSSSLHGIIVADAFGIPRRTEMTEIFNREGGDFKFRDHDATVGLDFEIGVTREAPRYIVQDRQQVLYDVFKTAGQKLAEKRR